MATRVTRKQVDQAVKHAEAVLRLIDGGILDWAVPDKYEKYLLSIIAVLKATRPLFPAR